MDKRNSGGGEYGHAAAGAGDYRSKDRNEEGADGGRWRNDMYGRSGTKQDNTHEAGTIPHRGNNGDWREGGYRDKGKWDKTGSSARNSRHGKGSWGGKGRDRGRGYGDGGHGYCTHGSHGGYRGGEDAGKGTGWRDRDSHRDEGYRDSSNWNNDSRGGDEPAQDWGGGDGSGDVHVDSGVNSSMGVAEDGSGKGGSERWRKYAETMSARAGSGPARRYDYGHGHDYSHRSQGRPEITGRREQGRVCSMKDSFGFVRCMDRPGDLFFHVREAPSNINLGDEVDFFVGISDRSGKDCALQLNVLPPGTVSSEVALDASFLGVIERDIRSGSSSMGRSRYQDYDLQQPEGLIKIMMGTATSKDDEADSDTKSSNTGRISTGDEGVHGGDADAVANADDDANTNLNVGGHSKEKVVAGAPLGLTGAMVTYVAADVVDKDEDASYTSNSASRLRRGDEVRFKVSQAKATGRKRAVEVVLVRTSKEKREQEQLQKLIESGASRHQGVVKKLTPDFGFLQSLSCPDSIYFSTADISTTNSKEGGRLRVGTQAEFWVVPDRTKDNRESLRALDMTLLPPGSFATEEETHKTVRGIVQRSPTMPQRQTNFGARDGGGNMQPGVARFSIPCSVVKDEGNEGSGGEATSIVASLVPKELGKGQVSSLEVGDEIEADLWRSKLGGGKSVAKNVVLVRFGGERVSGLVRTIRDGGFGFIRPLGENEDVYFRLADVCRSNEDERGNAPELHEGSEVMMTVRGSDRQGEKKRATRIQLLPRGTLELEIVLAKDVMGVVSRDAKGSGQGMITVTDGNDLEVPPNIRFPKIARQVREFAKKDKVKGKDLVFGIDQTTAERMAVHRLAAEAGLACHSKGEDSNRSLHVSKPKSEEEAISIKEAEVKRVDENLKAAKDRSKNGERSLSVPFSREDADSPALEPGKQDATTEPDSGTMVGSDHYWTTSGMEASPMRGEMVQDFRRERGCPTVAHRGDLVTFDVVLDRGNMKKRGTNVRVTKRAGQTSGILGHAKASSVAEDTVLDQEDEEKREHLGVVSLVQVERHYGFIDILDRDDRVFFHLSDVLPDEGLPRGEGSENASVLNAQTTPDHSTSSICNKESTNRARKGQEVTIRRGQEVAFHLGRRQGKTLGLCVRKLPAGSLPTEETVPGSFVGVVVVPPRNVGTSSNGTAGTAEDKEGPMRAAEMEGILVLLHEKKTAKVGDAQDSSLSSTSTSMREAEKEISKAHRMLSSAGLRVTSPPQATSTSAVAVSQSPGISPSKRRFSLGKGSVMGLKGPPSFSVLRFLTVGDTFEETKNAAKNRCDTKGITSSVTNAGDKGEGAAETEDGDKGDMATSSLCRGDLVEFVVVVRRGQRQFSQRIGKVSLLTKSGLPCRTGKVVQLDPKAGVAHVELLKPQTGGGGGASQSGDGAAADGDSDAPTVPEDGADGGGRVFFLLNEMVGAAGPVRTGDEVDLMLPTSSASSTTPRKLGSRNPPAGVHAVGAVRVQDMKSLSGARQRVNLDLRDSLLKKGQPQVRMAQGPDGVGFRQGHRPTRSFYAPKLSDGSSASERTAAKDGAETEATVMANT